MRQETEVHFLVGTVILGFLSIFKRSKALSPLSIELHVLLEGSTDVRPPVQIRRTPPAFSRVSPGNSDMPLSCEMKDKPEFKSLQGNRAFF